MPKPTGHGRRREGGGGWEGTDTNAFGAVRCVGDAPPKPVLPAFRPPNRKSAKSRSKPEHPSPIRGGAAGDRAERSGLGQIVRGSSPEGGSGLTVAFKRAAF